MAGRSTSEASIGNEENSLAKPLHLQRLEHAVRLDSFLGYINEQFQTAISSAEDSTENECHSEADGDFHDIGRVSGLFNSQEERRLDRMKLYNFSKVKKNRRCLKNILLSDTSESEDDDSDDAVYHMLKIHKLRSSASVEFTTDLQLHRYQYYSSGLLSVNDPFYEHQKLILSNKKRLKKANKKKGKAKKRKMEMDDDLSLSQQEEAIIREAMKLEEITTGLGDENSLEPIVPPTKSRKKNPVAHEAVMNMKRRRLWVAIGKKEINRAQKQMNTSHKEVLSNARRLAVACQRECRRSALLSQKIMKEIPSRARRLTKEMLVYWKRYDKVEKEHRKKAEKEAQEQLRIDIELREAKRQQRKLNFLITQTELYAHFMSKKIAGLNDEREKLILSQLNEEHEDGIHQNLALDDDYDVEDAKSKALKNAEDAFSIQQIKTKSFDSDLVDVLKNKDDFDESFHLTESSLSAEEEFSQPQMFEGKLKTYQLKGMNWLYNLYDKGINGILADEMGLGKTVQTIAFLATLAELQGIWGPFIIIAPASTLHNWQQEISKFVPKFKVLPYWGNTSDRKVLRKFWSQKDLHTEKSSFHVLITSYQLVVQDVKYFSRIKWQYMVLDEAQAIKSTSSVRWKILLGFSCRNRLLLTGTPIQNSMAELWALLHFIMPTLFDSHNEFNEWFSKDIESHAENKSAIDEKHLSRLHMILKPFMLRRIKKDVENELSDKIEILMYCQLTRRQKLLYKGLRNKISIDDLMQSSSSTSSQAQSATSSLMNLVMQFRKVCNHPDLFERREPKSPFSLKIDHLRLPKLLFQEILYSEFKWPALLPTIFHPLHVHRSIFPSHCQSDTASYSDCAFSFTRLIDFSPAEMSQAALSGHLARWLLSYLMFQGAYRIQHQRLWNSFKIKNCRRLLLTPLWLNNMIILASSSAFQELFFVQISSPVYTFTTHVLHQMGETPQHFKMRQLKTPHKDLFFHIQPKSDGKKSQVINCVSTEIPRLLLQVIPQVISQQVELYSYDPAVRWFCQRQNFKDSGQKKYIENFFPKTTFSYQAPTGLPACKPLSGWSKILIADKESLVTDSGKLQVLDVLLRRLKKEGHRVLIYSQMTRMIDLLEEYMWHRKHTYMRLDGSSKISDRRDMVADFQNRSDIFVFLLSTRAGGLGINLTAADTVIFYDSDWNPTVDQQAMDRAHRLGQTKQVTVYRLVCKDTIEERILQRAREKSEIQSMVISGGNFKPDTLKPKEVVSLLLDDEELERKFHQRQNERQQLEEDGVREKKRKRKKLEKIMGKKRRGEENITSRAPSNTSTPDGDSLFSVDSVPPSPYSEHSFSSTAIPPEESSNESQLVVDDASPSSSPAMPSLLTISDGNPFSLGFTLSPGSPSQSSQKACKRGNLRARGRPRGVTRRGSRGRGSTMATAAAELAAAQAGKSAAYAAYGYTVPSPSQQGNKPSLPSKMPQRSAYRGSRSLRRVHGVNPLVYRSSAAKMISSKKKVMTEPSADRQS